MLDFVKALQGTLAEARPFLPSVFHNDKSENDLVAGCYKRVKGVSSGLVNFTLQAADIGEGAAHYTVMGV